MAVNLDCLNRIQEVFIDGPEYTGADNNRYDILKSYLLCSKDGKNAGDIRSASVFLGDGQELSFGYV